MRAKSSIKRLSIDELYDIFETNQYDQFRTDFSEDVFMHRHNSTTPTLLTGLLCLGGNVPLVYQHIIAERLLAKPYDSIDWQEMDAYDFMTLLSLVYLWVYPLAWSDVEEDGQITLNEKKVQETFDKSRVEKVWDIANKLFNEGVLYFVDELPICTDDDIELGLVGGTHLWEYITANALVVVGDILQQNLKRQERWEACRMMHSKTLRYSIMYIVEQRNARKASEILRLLQSEWLALKTWQATGISKLSENEIQQFEKCLFQGFNKELEMWSQNSSSNNSTFVMSTDRAIKAMYDEHLCESADWAVVVRILEEQGKWPKSAFSYAADYINKICGDKVTTANSISRSILYTKVKRTFPNWEIKESERTREVPNKLQKYLNIGEVFIQAQNT